MSQSATLPYRSIPLGSCDITVNHRDDGCYLVRNRENLRAYAAKLSDRLAEGAERYPERVFIAERDRTTNPAGWHKLTYAQAWKRVRHVAQALLQRQLSAEQPVVILSGGSIRHAILGLAAMHIGIPHCAVNPAYSLLAHDHEKLRQILSRLSPGLIYVEDGMAYAEAVCNAVPVGVEVVHGQHPLPGRASTTFSTLEQIPASNAVERAAAGVRPDTVAKILFTSGSTGNPKGVIHTQRMLACNQVMMLQALPVIAEEPLVILSWLPWHHVSGGNQMLGLTLEAGGSLYLDDGRPTPTEIGVTVQNLQEVSPTIYFSVPRGFAMLVPYLKSDATLRHRFFSQLRLFYYSGATLGASLVNELDRLAEQAVGRRIPMMSGYGATETAPASLAANWITPETGLAGLPIPGCELKLSPVGAGKFEARVRGPHVTPGYWREPEATANLFDEEGYARLGDSLSWVANDNPSQGLAFDGRLSEDFKLATGTRVSAGALRARLIQASDGLLLDAVIVGEGYDEVGALLILDPTAADIPPPGSAQSACSNLKWRLSQALTKLAERATGSSTYIARAMILHEQPSPQAGELTDKGSINTRALLANRPWILKMLYAEPPDGAILQPERG